MPRKRRSAKKNEWTPRPYLVSAARRIWRWSPLRRECLKSGQCLSCGVVGKKLYADHIIPVGKQPSDGKWKEWGPYLERLFDGPLQPLCKGCHDDKTRRERKTA